MAQLIRRIRSPLCPLLLASVAKAFVVLWVNAGGPLTKDRSDMAELWLFPMANLVIALALIGLAIVVVAYAVQSGTQKADALYPPDLGTTPHQPAFPAVTLIPDYSPPTDGPGRYRIKGVDRNKKNDVIRDIEADSAANAKIKAELDGIIVTSITKTA